MQELNSCCYTARDVCVIEFLGSERCALDEPVYSKYMPIVLKGAISPL